MCKLLEQIEQCLYEFKHKANQPLKSEVKESLNEVELAFQNLVRIVNKLQGENK